MRCINCIIPVKVVVRGRPGPAQIEALGTALVRAAESQLAAAAERIGAGTASRAGAAEIVRGPWDKGRWDAAAAGYRVPSYDDDGKPRTVPIRRGDRGQDDDVRQDAAKDKAEQKHREKALQERRQPPPTVASTARDAQRQIQSLVAEAEQGKYQHVNTANRQDATMRFRKLLDQYRADDMRRIDRQLADGTVVGNQRKALVAQKKAIVLERSSLQGRFDEGMRTPRGPGVEAQGKWVHGGAEQASHELPAGRADYAQPDFTVRGETQVGGGERLHVNLKSHNLTVVTPAEARAIAREVTAQASKNFFGNPKRYGSVGNLPDADALIISFIDQPDPAIQAAMNEVMLAPDSPITEVRYGTATHTRSGSGPFRPLIQPVPVPRAPVQSPAEIIPGAPVRPEPEVPVRPEPEVPNVTSPRTSTLKSLAKPTLAVGGQIVLGAIHQRAQEERITKKAETEGWVPPGTSTGGVLDRVGEVLYDPLRQGDASIGFGKRFNMAAWRKRTREYFANRRPGEYLPFTWSDPDGWSAIAYYTLRPDGRWKIAWYVRGEAMLLQDVVPLDVLDINDVISTSVPDDELMRRLVPAVSEGDVV